VLCGAFYFMRNKKNEELRNYARSSENKENLKVKIQGIISRLINETPE